MYAIYYNYFEKIYIEVIQDKMKHKRKEKEQSAYKIV